jgi:hypothetical protein
VIEADQRIMPVSLSNFFPRTKFSMSIMPVFGFVLPVDLLIHSHIFWTLSLESLGYSFS